MFALHAVKSGHQFCTLLDRTRKTNQDTDMQMPCFSRSFYLDLSVRTWMGIVRHFNIAYDVLQCEPTKSQRRAIDIQSFTIAQASKQSWSHEICEIIKRFLSYTLSWVHDCYDILGIWCFILWSKALASVHWRFPTGKTMLTRRLLHF